MKFSILVLGAPYESQAAYSALRFAEAALADGHDIFRVFFYQQGVYTTTQLAAPPQDEFDCYQAWNSLQAQYQLDCVTCIAAAARRGIIDTTEAARHNKIGASHQPNFVLSGLGQLVEANAQSDRLITFGR
jgi:tRNA 2-thiouridine synthesizing protein D